MAMIRLIRRMVYGLGFRPRFGTILHSPSYIDTRQTMKAWIEKGFEDAMGHPYSQDDYERNMRNLGANIPLANLRIDPPFFCPLCGRGLSFSYENYYYQCPDKDGYFEVGMGRNEQGVHELVVKTVKLDG